MSRTITAVVTSAAASYLVWSDKPGPYVLIGGSLILGSGLYIAIAAREVVPLTEGGFDSGPGWVERVKVITSLASRQFKDVALTAGRRRLIFRRHSSEAAARRMSNRRVSNRRARAARPGRFRGAGRVGYSVFDVSASPFTLSTFTMIDV